MSDRDNLTGVDELLQGISLRAIELPANNIPEGGRAYTYEANAGELERISQVIGHGAFTSLVISYHVTPFRKNLVRMTSKLAGEITQTCGISLVPVQTRFEDEAVTLFVPERKFEEMLNLEDDDVLSDENFEPINDRRLGIGHVLYEQLVGAVNPYPRAPGVEFDPAVGGDGEMDTSEEGPFAALARLKKDIKN